MQYSFTGSRHPYTIAVPFSRFTGAGH